MSISGTVELADRLVEQAVVDQRAVLAELRALGSARMKELSTVVPDRERLKRAIKGLRGQGYIEHRPISGGTWGAYHISENCPDGHKDITDGALSVERHPIKPKLTRNPSGAPRLPSARIERSEETMEDYYKAKIEWYIKETASRDKEISSLMKSVNDYRAEVESLRNRGGVRRTPYEVLMDIANDPTKPDLVRIKAAAEAAQYDRPKLSASINRNENVTNIGDELDRARERSGLISGPD